MNTLLHTVYDDSGQAEQAIQELMAIGVARNAILSITSTMANSAAGQAHMGSFADSGAHTHDAERDHIGSFADSGAHTHDTVRDRVGGFADSASAAPNPTLAENLVRAGLSQADARSAVRRLDTGGTLVLVRVEGEAATRAAAILQYAD